MTTDSGIPPIVLIVGLQQLREGWYVSALEEAGYWVSQADSPEDALLDIADLRPDVVVADATAGHALEAQSAVSTIPLVVVDEGEPVAPPALRNCVERALAAFRESQQRPADAAQAMPPRVERRQEVRQKPRVCPACARPLVWAERGTVGGIEYDYYRWCPNGCGLYCFPRATDEWLKLA